MAAAPRVAALLAAELGYSEAWEREQVERYTELATGYTLSGVLDQAR
jgi:glycerol-3-phosphate dehydrogenase